MEDGSYCFTKVRVQAWQEEFRILVTEKQKLEQETQRRYAQVLDLREQVKAKDKTIHELKKTITEQEKAIAMKDTTIDKQEKAITDQKKTIAEKDKTIAEQDKAIEFEQSIVNTLQLELGKRYGHFDTSVIGQVDRNYLNEEFTNFFEQKFKLHVEDYVDDLVEKNSIAPEFKVDYEHGVYFHQFLHKVLIEVVIPCLTCSLPWIVYTTHLFAKMSKLIDVDHFRNQTNQPEHEILRSIFNFLKKQHSLKKTVQLIVEEGLHPVFRDFIDLEIFPYESPFSTFLSSPIKDIMLNPNFAKLLKGLLTLRVLMKLVDPPGSLFVPQVNDDLDRNKHYEPPAFCVDAKKIHYTLWPGLEFSGRNDVLISKAHVVTSLDPFTPLQKIGINPSSKSLSKK